MSFEGENFVSIRGLIQRPNFKHVGQNNTPLFKGSLAIPIGERNQYVKVAAWAGIAEGLAALPEGSKVHIHGHIEERSYEGKCKLCQGPEKKYWTEVVIDAFQAIQ